MRAGEFFVCALFHDPLARLCFCEESYLVRTFFYHEAL